MPKVVLTGTYCSRNKGDFTMQLVCASALRARLPDLVVTIATPFPAIDREAYSEFRVVRSGRRNLIAATFYWWLLVLIRVLRLGSRRLPLPAEIDELLQADVVIDLSGDMQTEDYGPLVGYSHLLPLLQAGAIGKRLILCAQSIGPFRRLSYLARRAIGHAELVTCRESISVRTVSAMRLPRTRVSLTADLAFLLPTAGSEAAQSILGREDIRLQRPKVLGLSVSALLLGESRRFKSDADNELSMLAKAVDRVAAAQDADIVLIPHVFGPRRSADDRVTCRKFADILQRCAGVINGEYHPSELKAVIAICDGFVGYRMHACIAALDSGVPTLAVSYSHKTIGIFGDLQLGDWVVGRNSGDRQLLESRMNCLFTQGAAYRQRLAEILPDCRSRAAGNIEYITGLIGTRTGDRN